MPRLTSFIRRQFSRAVVAGLLAGVAWSQQGYPPEMVKDDKEPKRLPDGRLQSEAILKSDYEANLRDLGEMKKLMEEVEGEMKKNAQHVMSLGLMKKLEEMEKLARRVRGRMRRF